jgi:hypothetical protein
MTEMNKSVARQIMEALHQPDLDRVRAYVHLRSGMQVGQEPVSDPGIAALYDLVLLGMHDYIARHEECASFVENTDPWDAAALFHALVSAGVFDDPLTFNRFSLIVERTLWQGSFSFDADSTLAEVEKMLMQLGVGPFREDEPIIFRSSSKNNQ